MMPEFFADHIGNLTVELVLAAVEISTLLIRVRPSLETLAVLQEAEAFPGNDAEGYITISFIISHFLHLLYLFLQFITLKFQCFLKLITGKILTKRLSPCCPKRIKKYH